jgi:hypothetical protein
MDEMVCRGGIVAVQCLVGVCSNFVNTELWAHVAIPSTKAYPTGAAADAINGYRKK